MKKCRKILSYILLIAMFALVSNLTGVTASAESISNVYIESEDVPDEAIDYGMKEFKKDIKIVEQNIDMCDFSGNEFEKAYLGTPFSIYSYENGVVKDSKIYYFPIISEEKIISFLIVSKDEDGKYIATFSEGFAEQLSEVLRNCKSDSIKVLSIDNIIYAIEDGEYKLLADYRVDKKDNNEDLNNKTPNISLDNKKLVNINKQLVKVNSNNIVDKNIIASAKASDVSYNILKNMKVVRQYDAQWCAGAACATILNYKRGLNLTAKDVMSYIKGTPDPDKNVGAKGSEIVPAYKHYGYNVTLKPAPLSFAAVIGELALDKPINALTADRSKTPVVGHSMVIGGYYLDKSTKNAYYFVLDPNREKYQVVPAIDTGFKYHLGTYVLSWVQTIN